VGGVDKAKRVLWLGLHRYKIDESMFSIKMDSEAGERERGDNDMCTTLLRKKYMKDKGFFCVNPSVGSQF
jgi:hypothetical protein